jgi:hypothetical protein
MIKGVENIEIREVYTDFNFKILQERFNKCIPCDKKTTCWYNREHSECYMELIR